MHAFEQLMYFRFMKAIEDWDIIQDPDIYAISLLYGTTYTMDSKGHEIVLQSRVLLSYNTLRNFEKNKQKASSSDEAKWSFTYWLQNFSSEIPVEPEYGFDPDLNEFSIRDSWCESIGLMPTNKNESDQFIYSGPDLERAVVGLCENVVFRLNNNKIIFKKFDKIIPIIIHDFEYSSLGMEATKRANPEGLIDSVGFPWCKKTKTKKFSWQRN